MFVELPIVSFDESGNTGPDLLNEKQPIFALASVCLGEDAAGSILAPLHGTVDERKFSDLRRDTERREGLLEVLASAARHPEVIRVSLFHKPYTTVAKMVDLLMEPGFYRRGMSAQWQTDGSAVRWPTSLYELAPAQLGMSWELLLRAFVRAVRRPSRARTDEVAHLLDACLQKQPDARVGFPLEVMREQVREALGSFYNDKGRPYKHTLDPLDPAIAALVEHLDHWGQTVGAFDAHHDESQALKSVLPHIERLSDPNSTPVEFQGLDRTASFPLRVRRISMVDSKGSLGVQLADLLAGACAFQQGAFERKSADANFAQDVASTGVRAVFDQFVAPASFVARSMEGID